MLENAKEQADSLVYYSFLNPGTDLPLVITPATRDLTLSTWAADHWGTLESKLFKYGALLFRGFGLKNDQDFVSFMAALPHPRLPYFEGATPRKAVGDGVFTSTEYPPEQSIALHSEHSSSTRVPLKLFFYCEEPPATQGETPIGDARKILARVDPQVRATFQRLGWRLIRNFGDGLGLPWRRAFAMDSREQLDRYAKTAEIELEWKSPERLRSQLTRSSTLLHPTSGEEVWFNHVAFWHAANLPDTFREEMLEYVGLQGLPYHTYYGDGSPIPDQVARHIRDCYLAEKVKFSWQKGDVLVVDNILTVHGREPFKGARKIRVAMLQLYDRPHFRAT